MTLRTDKMRYQVKARMDFIWDTLRAQGRINRADLICEYGISEVQASKDFQGFLGMYPTAMTYGRSTVKRGHEHHRSIRRCSAREGRPRCFGGAQRGGGT